MIEANLVEEWIYAVKFDVNSGKYEEAILDVNDMSIDEPDEIWKFILEVLKETNNEKVLSRLAAGPLENLLSLNPERAYEQIEMEARKNDKLRAILGGLWQNLIPDDIWKKLQKIK